MSTAEKTRRGATIGAFVGAGLAAMLLTVFQGGGDEPECDGACRLQGTAIGAAIGAATGATIGVFFLRWRLAY